MYSDVICFCCGLSMSCTVLKIIMHLWSIDYRISPTDTIQVPELELLIGVVGVNHTH